MAKLRLTDWASIAEIIGAVAVVISLIYVGIQIRDNTNAVRAANMQTLVGRAHRTIANAAASPELAEVFAKASNGGTLTPAEAVQYGLIVRASLYDTQEAYLLHRDSSLDEEYWNTRVAFFKSTMNQQLARDIYIRDKNLGIFHVDFVAWADSELENGADR